MPGPRRPQCFPGDRKPLAQPPSARTSEHQLLCCKSIDKLIAEADEPGHRLKKTLGPWSLTALGIGAIIGSGIFVLHGHGCGGGALRGSVDPARAGFGPDRQLPAHGQHGGSADARTSAGRTFHRDLVSAGRCGLQFCRPVLCRAGVDDPDRGQRLHLFLRDPGRDFCLDHRLGSDSGICGEQRGGRGRLQRIRQGDNWRLSVASCPAWIRGQARYGLRDIGRGCLRISTCPAS